jgi:peptide/nickel transport system ATP-binding protein
MIHHRIQMIFQDPGASLNPRFSVGEALQEPLVIRGASFSRQDTADRLEQVGLAATMADRRTTQLSGGQKARLALARALAALKEGQPNILILDESLSSLDLSIQAQMINLLVELQEPRQLAYILIAHDLDLVQRWADEIVVMQEGQIVERGAPPHV